LEIKVEDNDLEKALKAMKRKIQREGLLKDLKKRSFYEKPSEKKKRKRIEARRKKARALKIRRTR
jgi:small subunit ribosomal protein S21